LSAAIGLRSLYAGSGVAVKVKSIPEAMSDGFNLDDFGAAVIDVLMIA
jgi:hypothetical protein